MMLDHYFARKERPAPGLVTPARRADKNLSGAALFHHARCCANNRHFRRWFGALMQKRWLILAVLTFSRTAMGFQFQSVAASSPLLIEHFQFSYALLGTLIGLYLFPGVAVAIPGGLLAQ